MKTLQQYWTAVPAMVDRVSKGEGGSRMELANLIRDAERYRWLRKQTWWSSPIAIVANPKHAVKLGEDCPNEERLDVLIDAVMSGVHEPHDHE